MPLRAIRERLRRIRYYSATRPYDRWSRALDIALVAALVAAWPATWLLDRVYVAAGQPFVIAGGLYQDPDQRVWAWVRPPDEPPAGMRGDAVFYGAFRVEMRAEDRGWPFVTSRGPSRLALNVNLFESNQSLGAGALPPDSPARRAIDAALTDAGQGRIAAAMWAGSAIEPFNRTRGWIANGLVLSVLLVIAAWLLVSVLRLASLFRAAEKRQQAIQRSRQAKCAVCGYDLRGSVRSDRCPECGTIA